MTADSVPNERLPLLRRITCGLLLLVSAISFLLFYLAWWRPYSQFRNTYDRVWAAVRELQTKDPPPGVSLTDWEYCTRWNRSLVGNCCSMPEFLKEGKRDDFRRFADELEARVRGDVDLHTIDWIWDQMIDLSRYGERYSLNWRPTPLVRQRSGHPPPASAP